VTRALQGTLCLSTAAAVLLALGMQAAAAESAIPETPRALPVEDAIARTLASRRYSFCFDPRYPLLDDEVRWCDQLPRSPDAHATRCPSFLVACRAGAKANLVHKQKPFDIHLPNFGGAGRMVLLVLTVAAVLLVVFLAVRQGLRSTPVRRPRRDAVDADVADAPTPDVVRDSETERDVDRLLARARAAAGAGDFLAAVSDLRAALLRRLGGDGHVRIHPAATNGDYVRELRVRVPDLAGPVDQVVRDVEAAQFGIAAADNATYSGLLARIGPLLARSSATVLLLLGILPLPLLFGSCQTSLRADWAASPSGTAAVIEFLTAAGLSTRERLSSLSDIGDAAKKKGDVSQIVLLPDAEVGVSEWAALRNWLNNEDKTLVVAMGPRALPDWLGDVEWVGSGAKGPIHPTEALPIVGSMGVLSRGHVPGTAWIRTATAAPEDSLLVRGGHSYARLAAADVGRVIVLADEDLLTNASLVVGDNAALLEALLRSGGGPIEFVGSDTGLVAPTPLASVARGRLAPFMAQLGACLILFLLMEGRAFGRLIDPDESHRRVFGEHVRALGTQYARARGAGHVLAVYATWAVERLRERIRLSGDQGIGDLSVAVAARTGRSLGDVARVLFAARKDSDNDVRGGAIAGAATLATEDRSRAGVEQQLAMMRELRQLLADTSAGTSGPSRAIRRTGAFAVVNQQTEGKPRS
jgi:hypothetical protein